MSAEFSRYILRYWVDVRLARSVPYLRILSRLSTVVFFSESYFCKLVVV